MIQQILTIWSLVPLTFLNPAWTSVSSWFTYYLSLAFPDYSGQKDYFLSGFLKPTMTHYSATETFLKILPSPCSLCLPHKKSVNPRCGIGKRKGLNLGASCEDSSLVLQNNHLVRAWMSDSFNDQTCRQVRKQSKKIIWFLEMSPRMASLG